jgi:2-hydroxychromene-2-carboxylate isomerase
MSQPSALEHAPRSLVEMWFDPACPWAWITSRWLLEVELVRPVEVHFRVMSLAVLNEGRQVLESYAQRLERARGSVRVCVAVAQRHGDEAVRDLYTTLGARIHRQKQPYGPELYEAALAEAGLDRTLAAAATSEEYDEAVRASHEEGMALVGDDVGTPVIHTTGPDGQRVGFFGPVVTLTPRGEAAGRLWDGVVLVTGTPGFYELKRTRDQRPTID